MLKQPTVFVIGAGASAEINLPIGSGLRGDIISLVDCRWDLGGTRLSGDAQLLEQVRAHSGKSELDFQAAGQRIVAGIFGRNSIDEFLDWHRDDEAVVRFGKAAIARAILSYEARADETVFRSHGGFSLGSFDDKWFGRMFRMLNAGLTLSQADRLFHNAKFVIFNYDRAVENFFYWALQAMDVPAKEAQAICNRPDVFLHPYGQLGPLFGADAIKFGEVSRAVNPAVLSDNIRTFTEGDGHLKADIQAAMSRATSVVYLGFSYNETNLRLLTPIAPDEIERLFGTTFGLPDAVSHDLPPLLKQLHPPPGTRNRISYFANLRCADFLREMGERIVRGSL